MNFDPHCCRNCGKGLRKATQWRSVMTTAKAAQQRDPRILQRYLVADLTDRQDCEQHTGGHKVTSVTHGRDGFVCYFTTWDGVSYADDYFCSQKCAAAIGRQAAKQGAKTEAYDKAADKVRLKHEKMHRLP